MAVLITGAMTQKPFVRHSNYFPHYMKKVQQLEILIISTYYTFMVLKACPRETLIYGRINANSGKEGVLL